MNKNVEIAAEIAAIRNANPAAEILVSVDANGETPWGEVMALEAGEMEKAIREAFGDEGSTAEMLTAEQWERRYL